MKKITLNDNIVNNRAFKKYFCKYVQKKGYKTPVEHLPHDILTELMASAVMCYSALDLNIGEEFELTMAEGITFKCKKISKYELLFDKDSFVDALEIPTDDPMFEVLSNPANHRVLAPSENFKHPLAEVNDVEVDGEVQKVLNGYAVASLIIDAIRNPEVTNDNGKKATDFLTRTVLESGKNVNVQALIERIKAGQLRAMMEASTLINDGFHNIAHSQMGK